MNGWVLQSFSTKRVISKKEKKDLHAKFALVTESQVSQFARCSVILDLMAERSKITDQHMYLFHSLSQCENDLDERILATFS